MIKPREMWAVISPDGEEEFRRKRYWKCISLWLGCGDEKLTADAVVGWVRAMDSGYRCVKVKVKVTAEEI